VKLIGKLLLKYKALVLSMMGPLGIWGIGLISAVDSGTVPVPMDLILATFVWNDRKHFYFYVLVAAAGSAIGGLIPYLLGRAGGELFLLKHVDRVKYDALMARFEKREFLAMTVPSMLPPPTPWKLFAFGAGVFGMPVWSFMLAVFLGRMVRFGVEALLTILYGPEIIHIASDLFRQHLLATLASLGLVLALLLVWLLHRRRRDRRQIVAR
jgi:membrane protein YqaA with SNARE-associated domain